jgi:hypothetical protein
MRSLRVALVVALVLAGSAARAGAKGGPPKPAPPPKVAPEKLWEKIRTILSEFRGARSWTTSDPRIDAIVAYGRPAIEPLIRYLREAHLADSRGSDFDLQSAALALSRLVDDRDIPALARLLDDGQLEAAGAFASLRSPAARDALLVPMRKGFVSWDLMEALEAYRGEPPVRKATLEFLEKFGSALDYGTGTVARFAAGGGMFDALPVLKRLLALGGGNARLELAKAVVHLADAAGIPVLLEIFAAGDEGGAGFDRHEAGEELNRILRERIYVGSYDGPATRGNFAVAAERFAAWWEKAKEKIRYDAKRGRWLWD